MSIRSLHPVFISMKCIAMATIATANMPHMVGHSTVTSICISLVGL